MSTAQCHRVASVSWAAMEAGMNPDPSELGSAMQHLLVDGVDSGCGKCGKCVMATCAILRANWPNSSQDVGCVDSTGVLRQPLLRHL